MPNGIATTAPRPARPDPTRKEFGPAGIVSSVLLIAVSANLVAAVLGWFGWAP